MSSATESKRAGSRIARLVKSGRMLPAYEQVCWDCEDTPARQYDHAKGYSSEFVTYVEPVCSMCHQARHNRRFIEGTGNPIRPKTTAERARNLNDDQRAKMDELKRLYEQRLDASRNIVNAILKCQGADVSYGIMGHELGVSAQNLQQLVKSFRQRQEQGA